MVGSLKDLDISFTTLDRVSVAVLLQINSFLEQHKASAGALIAPFDGNCFSE
jgi:hypothetical protein